MRSGSRCCGEVSQPPQFALLQNLREVNQDHEASVQLADSGHVLHFAFFKDFRGSFDLVVGQTELFGSRIHDEPHLLLIDFGNQDAILARGFNSHFAESLAQIDDRDDLPPQVDHAFDVIWHVGHGRDFRDTHNFVHQPNRNAERFFPDTEPNELEIFRHAILCRRSVDAGRVTRGVVLLSSRSAGDASIGTAVAMSAAIERLEDKTVHGIQQRARHLGHLIG